MSIMAKALNGKELGKGITQLRNGTYQARVYIKGNDKPIYASSKRLEEVKQKREKILEQYNLGLQTDASKKTLNDWFDEWMELYVVGKVKPRTVQNYIREYERCKSYIGHITLDRLQPTYIQKMVNELFKKGYKRATVNNIEENDSDRLTDEQIKKFFNAAAGTRYYELFVILLNTGMRIGEACALEWKDIDFEKRSVYIYKTIGTSLIYYDKYGEKLKEPYYLTQITSPKKEASVRKIPLTETAIKAFEDWRIKQEKDIKKLGKKWGKDNVLLKQYPELIFTTQKGNCYMPNVAGKECTRIAQKMNTDEKNVAESEGREYRYIRVHPHMFRHTFISLCYEAGMDTSVILRISGHKHIKMMKYYTHLEENFVNKEFDKIREKM
jgi:integrase